MSQLILMRHGQSGWNLLDIFTGWVDISLTPKGVEEALEGGRLIQDIPIDKIFTSTLVRAQTTAILAMCHHKSQRPLVFEKSGFGRQKCWSKSYSKESLDACIPVTCAWQLNERMYGRLQGLNKQKTREKYGDEQVRLWRRSYDVRPPGGESLKLTAKRTIPYFQKKIVPYLKQGKNILISAHGNSLRSIVMEIEHLSKEDVLKLEIPTGKPLFYSFENGKFLKQT